MNAINYNVWARKRRQQIHAYLSALSELALANISLELLDLSNSVLVQYSQQVIATISKFHNLKTLRYGFAFGFRAADLIELCMHLNELSEIHLFCADMGVAEFKLTKNDLLELITKGENTEVCVQRVGL